MKNDTETMTRTKNQTKTKSNTEANIQTKTQNVNKTYPDPTKKIQDHGKNIKWWEQLLGTGPRKMENHPKPQ